MARQTRSPLLGKEPSMKHVRTLLVAVAAAGLAACLGAAPVQARVDGPVPTFKQFKASTFRDADGQFIVNGDEPVANKRQLKAYYNAMRGWDQALIVNTVGWRAGQVDRAAGAQPDLLREHEVRRRLRDRRQRDDAGCGAVGGRDREGELRLRADPGRRLHHPQQHGAVLGGAHEDPAVHRAGVLPEHPQERTQHPGERHVAGRPAARGRRATSSATSSGTPSASATSTPAPRPAPASRTTTGWR